jgi:hypothetical protein
MHTRRGFLQRAGAAAAVPVALHDAKALESARRRTASHTSERFECVS